MGGRDIGGSVEHIADEILDYLTKNPRAADTADGIEQWWLRGKHYPRARVQAALDYLVDHNKLKKRSQANGDVYFLPGCPLAV